MRSIIAIRNMKRYISDKIHNKNKILIKIAKKMGMVVEDDNLRLMNVIIEKIIHLGGIIIFFKKHILALRNSIPISD